MDVIFEAIEKLGFSAVLLAYLIYKDYKFNQNILDVLASVKVILAKLETWHSAEEGEK